MPDLSYAAVLVAVTARTDAASAAPLPETFRVMGSGCARTTPDAFAKVRVLAPGPASPAAAHVTPSFVGRRTVLSVSGEIDLDSASQVADAIDDALADGALELWIDLSRTEFMDSSGVHLLLDTRGCVRELNRRLAVVCPGGCIRRLLEVAGVAGQLPLFDDRAAAHRAA